MATSDPPASSWSFWWTKRRRLLLCSLRQEAPYVSWGYAGKYCTCLFRAVFMCLQYRVRNCDHLGANETKNWVLATRISGSGHQELAACTMYRLFNDNTLLYDMQRKLESYVFFVEWKFWSKQKKFILATKPYDLATKIFWLVASWLLYEKVNFVPCSSVVWS